MENPPQPPPQCVIPIHKPSLREYAFFFITGIVVSIPFAAFFESIYPFSMALLIVVVAPFIEELAKVYPLFYRHGETERSIVTLGLLIGLGFGIAELVEYTIIGGVPFYIRIPGVIFHASSATITAYGIAKKNPLPYYLIAVSLHVINNFFALTTDLLALLVQLLVLIVVYWLAWRFYHKARPDVMVT
ncbi:MAG: PrsW family intramembrane metalloprotease [Candidatus Bathyarchaeota archaeon]|nr:PrsW family intramembrane metalloprotease [Candidatus Bathyarchaeota archaeon]